MKNCMHEAVQGGKTRIMKYLHQFLLILAISFMERVVERSIAVPGSGQYLWNGNFVCWIIKWIDSGWSGEGSRSVPDRDHAGNVYPCRRWSDGGLGYFKTHVASGQCDYDSGSIHCNGIHRASLPVGDWEKAETGRFRR